MISNVDINPSGDATVRATVGGGAVRGHGAANQRAAHLHFTDRSCEQHATIYSYGPQQTAELADALASLVGQLLATVNRDDVDDDLATNIDRNLYAASHRWGTQRPDYGLGSVADAVAEDAR